MKVADILRIKGSGVKAVAPHETALLLSGHLRAAQIGALVVSTDGNSIDGIVSERDLAYGPRREVTNDSHLRTDDESVRCLLA
jgi:hypothetical protein